MLDAVSSEPSYDGQALRTASSPLMFGASSARPLGAWSGVRIGTPTDTVSVSGSTYTVDPHSGIIDEHTSAVAGPYSYAVTVAETGSVDPADATHPRKDIISVRVDDPAQSDGSSVPAAVVEYTAGTAAASPTAPATPDRSILLATLNVPASGGGSTSVVWEAAYTGAAGCILPARNDTQRDAILAAVGSSTEAPLYVHHADDGLIRSTDDSTWGSMEPTPVTDTGIKIVTPSSVAGTGVTLSGAEVAFSAASSVSINGCFTSTYDNYRVIINIPVTASTPAPEFTLRASGTDDTSSVYDNQRITGAVSSAGATQVLASDHWILGFAGRSLYDIDLTVHGPALVEPTRGILSSNAISNPMGALAITMNASLLHRTSSAFDGLTVSCPSGSMTGTIRVYGYNNG